MKTYSPSPGTGTRLIEKQAESKIASTGIFLSTAGIPSVAMFAFLIFAILNVFSVLILIPTNYDGQFNNIDKSLYRLRQRVFNSPYEIAQSGSWPWWVARAYLTSKTPDIVVMGDSQINAAFFQTDAVIAGKPVDCAVDRSCPALKAAIRERALPDTANNLRLVSLAMGGAMPSDHYLMSKALLPKSNTQN